MNLKIIICKDKPKSLVNIESISKIAEGIEQNKAKMEDFCKRYNKNRVKELKCKIKKLEHNINLNPKPIELCCDFQYLKPIRKCEDCQYSKPLRGFSGRVIGTYCYFKAHPNEDTGFCVFLKEKEK